MIIMIVIKIVIIKEIRIITMIMMNVKKIHNVTYT